MSECGAGDVILPATKRFRKIPVYVVEEHNDALQFIYSAIGGKKLPLEGTTMLHFDAHPDMLIDRKLQGADARAGRKVLPLLQIENWIVPAVAAGHLSRVAWVRPPWARQFTDGTRVIRVGDHPATGCLRVSSTEPYYMSDALYSHELLNERTFNFTVAELSDSEPFQEVKIQKLAESINISQPYVLDIDLDFFSTVNPFLGLYENIGLYDLLEPIFDFNIPEDRDEPNKMSAFVELRERQLDELEALFHHLEENGSLDGYQGKKTEAFDKVSALADTVCAEAERLGERVDWWAMFAGGCTRDQGGLPHHVSGEEEVRSMVRRSFAPLLARLPRPVLITVARSTEDGYCPTHQVDFIQSLVLEALRELFDTDDPQLYYLTVNTF